MRIYDISVPISAATPTYPGDPGVEIRQWAALAEGDPANVSLLHFGAHTATHVDAPAHFIAGTPGVGALPLEALLGEAHVVAIPEDAAAITPAHLAAHDFSGATRVLFKTRNSAFWSDMTQGFRKDFTYLAPDSARVLVELGVRLVGIDYLSIEEFGSEKFEAHRTLLSSGIVILEGLDLRAVEAGVYELLCLPLKIAGGTGDGAPARAVLRGRD
ncbi:MAG TPA: cyclase family protein [Pyrinomonadaceae bacterium]|jgi:arylformamidase